MKRKLKILFFDNSTKLETVRDLETRGRGGMVTSLFKVSDFLSREGHDVWVLSDIAEPGKTAAGTSWIAKGCRIWEKKEWDALVLNRGTGDAIPEIRAKRRVLWTHDLPHNGFIPDPRTAKAIDLTIFMSGYAEWVWRAFYRTIGKSARIPNGVDKTIFHPREEKDLGYLIFASAPNRGLKRLPLIFEAIKSRVDRPVRMRAFSNMKALHPNEIRGDDDGFSLDYKNCRDAGIELMDPVPQTDLAEELGMAGLMILPTDYPEICSNIILQSLASGTPIITTGGIGSAGEWVENGWNGRLTEYQPVDYMIHTVEMVRSAVSVLEDENLHRRMIGNAARTKGIYTWEEVGLQWEKQLRKLF